ncbi:hypothetical protein BDA96_08G185600 [Sorghum bicolor]|uniref:Uncharacterized protein n=2 Tax=Sorghum bicolor TaxID=4558 RepID=A0A921U804_SORBI|nr:hypothetical protein BDA96_08G185600 [Sorghum bicolor]KXG23986.1 hypothetical protein SORBI_3008G167900 [Sorghum bicolor]
MLPALSVTTNFLQFLEVVKELLKIAYKYSFCHTKKGEKNTEKKKMQMHKMRRHLVTPTFLSSDPCCNPYTSRLMIPSFFFHTVIALVIFFHMP